jgi:rare lipoprotein A
MSVTIKTFFVFLLTASWILSGCASQIGHRPGYNRMTGRTTNKGTPVSKGYQEAGMISYYGPGFHGKKTANGETFNQNDLTAAHRTLPFNTKIKVTLLSSGKSVVVRINDRGPFKKNRILDLSKGAAKKVGLIQSGTAKAKIVVL